MVRYYGRYSNASRGKRNKALQQTEGSSPDAALAETEAATVELSSARRRWTELLRRVYEIDPLVRPKCGGEMRVIGFITEPTTIRRIQGQGASPARAASLRYGLCPGFRVSAASPPAGGPAARGPRPPAIPGALAGRARLQGLEQQAT